MEKYNFEFPKTGRFFTSKSISGKEKEIWIVLHGYRQLANYFLKKFEGSLTDDVLVIAPEGIHRFYVEGYSGRVGASWMTTEDREDDIYDYTRALGIMLNQILESFENKPKINLLGFSQGAATAMRWFCSSEFEFNRFVIWAGSFPKDIDYSANMERLNTLTLELILGDQDEFINKEKMASLEKYLVEHKISYSLKEYSGNHDIDKSVFLSLLSQE